MAKKRFIKTLMSKGISRNEANGCAWFAFVMRIPYAKQVKNKI